MNNEFHGLCVTRSHTVENGNMTSHSVHKWTHNPHVKGVSTFMLAQRIDEAATDVSVAIWPQYTSKTYIYSR